MVKTTANAYHNNSIILHNFVIKMIESKSLKQLFRKDVRTICLSIGGFYVVFGAFAILMVKIQTMMLINVEGSASQSFINSLKILHEIWMIYMPLLIVLGLGYLLFGLLFKRLQAIRYQANILLSIFCLIWAITYSISCSRYFDVFFAGMTTDFEALKYVAYGFAGFGLLAVFVLLTVPQFVISKRLKVQRIDI
jgi:hypothetical protein